MEISKLAQARIQKDLTQAQVAEYTGVDVGTVCRWEKGTHQPYLRHVKKLCDLFGQSAQELGLAPSEPVVTPLPVVPVASFKDGSFFASYFQQDVELRLQYIISDWLYCEKPSGASSALLQYRLSQELGDISMNEQSEQNHRDANISRRAALRRLALFPIHAWGLDALNATPKWKPEDILPHCAAGITACKHLSEGQAEDMSLAYGVLTTYLTPLKEIVDQSSMHREEAAGLVGQALLLKATLGVHREGPKRAVNYAKQAAIYSKESGNIPLQLTTLKLLAWTYALDRQEGQALTTISQAQSLLQKQQKKGIPIHPLTQSSIYGGVAKWQARNGQEKDAIATIRNAFDAFHSPEEGFAVTYVDFNYSTLILEDGMTHYHLGQYEKALEIFDQAIDLKTLAPKVPASSERVRVEIINHEALTSLKSPNKDMELSIQLWKAGIQGAIDLRSEQRFGEALTAYDIMQALWPGDRRIKELRDLTRHW
jgi:transcriptional regulator with XRE-family HTH domain